MAAYMIAIFDIVDPDGYQGYVPGVRPLLQMHGAEVLAADYDAQAIEGPKRSACVVLKFESEAAALAWYHDPAYGPVKKIRLDSSSNTNVLLAKGFVRPGV